MELCAETGLDPDVVRRCELDAADVDAVVEVARAGAWAARARERLEGMPAPLLVGVSVMFAEQVIPGLVVSRLARELWPAAPIVWGGAHVTALSPEIAREARYGRLVDGFVAGYAEGTFVELLGAIRAGTRWPTEVLRAAAGLVPRARGDLHVVPDFGALKAYRFPRLTLPAQVTRGCSYARCTFCTYPFVEGRYLEPSWSSLDHIEPIIVLAAELGAVVSFKDALMTAPYLRRVARRIDGRVPWAACTKLAPALVDLLPTLAAAGCETLEVGLETIVEGSQLVIRKPVKRGLVEAFLHASKDTTVRVVVNYMTGLPDEGAEEAASGLSWIRALAEGTGAVVEHHVFELERRAPLAAISRVTRTWPWASVVGWEPGARC